MTVAAILLQAGILLQDEDHTRWPLAELAAWVDDGVRAVIMARPDVAPVDIIIPMVPGTLQTVPRTGIPRPQALLSLTRNIRETVPVRLAGRAITATNRLSLDGRTPDWHDETKTPRNAVVRQFYVDAMDPMRFWVYPGNTGAGLVEAIVSALPDAIVAAPGQDGLAAYPMPVPMLREQFITPLTDYVCFRAQSKDDVAANAGRASVHYQAFATAVGLSTQAAAGSQPNRRVSG